MNKLLIGDCREILPTLPSNSIQCIVTSPPYYQLRDYGTQGQIGQEDSVEQYVNNLVCVFHDARRILKNDGTLWLNLGDSYAGSGKGRNHDGKQGKLSNGSKEEKLREVVEAPTDRIVLVGTKQGTSLPEDEVKNLVLNRPELVIEEETIDFKVQEQKNDKLPAGQTRVLQEGKKGIRIHLIEVENGKRTEKESYDKVVAQDRIVEVGTAGETTKPVPQESTKPQVSEKTDTKEIASSAADQVQKEQLPNTGSAEGQAAVAAGLALLGLSAGLVATKGKKED